MIPGRRRTISGADRLLLIFGLIFAAMAAVVVYRLLMGHPVTVNGRPGRPDDAWMPAIFVVVGLALAGMRSSKVIDLDARTIVTTWGWLWWTRRTEAGIGDWMAVEVSASEERGSGSGRYTAVPVRLRGSRGDVEVDAPRKEVEARRLAKWLAVGADLPLRDTGDRMPVERPPERLDEPLLSRLQPGDLEAAPPVHNRLRIEDRPHGLRVRVPVSRRLFLTPLLLIPLSLPFLFWWFIWRPGLVEPARGSYGLTLFLYAPLAMVALPLIGMLVSAHRRGAFGYWIEADQDGLRALGRSIEARSIEDLSISTESRGRGRRLRAISGDAVLSLGIGLREDELAWLRAAILRAMRGG